MTWYGRGMFINIIAGILRVLLVNFRIIFVLISSAITILAMFFIVISIFDRLLHAVESL